MTQKSVTQKPQQNPGAHSNDSDLKRLRSILLGKDYQELLVLKRRLNNQKHFSMQVASVVSEALAQRAEKDDSLVEVLPPLMESTLIYSIKHDPGRLINVLYPVLGPAIRKSIHDALAQTLETVNQLLEQSISPRSVRWRFDAWRSGRSYAEVALLNTLEYQVEQVFLIHAETGLLLQHAESGDERSGTVSQDPDIVSGMLTAIQDFIADAFTVAQGDTLKSMRLGALTVLVEQGPYAFIAAVVRGNVPARLPELLRQTQEDIHGQMKNSLWNYQGDSATFDSIHPLLKRCLLSRVQEKPKAQPVLPYLAAGCLLAGLCYWGYQAYTDHREASALAQAEAKHEQTWQGILAALSAEPGIVLIKTQRDGGKYYLQGMADPLARQPEEVLAASGYQQSRAGEVQTLLRFEPYLSLEPQIVLRRVQQMLQPPLGISLTLDKGVLSVSGAANERWQTKLKLLGPALDGVAALDTSELNVFSDTP